MNYKAIVKLLSASEIRALYNRYADTPVRKFTTRTVAEDRTAKLLEESSVTQKHIDENPAISAESKQKIAVFLSKPEKSAPPAPAPEAAKPPKEKKAPKPDAGDKSVSAKEKAARGKFKGKTIRKIAKDNPFKAGSSRDKSWGALKDGMKFEEYRTAKPICGTTLDLGFMVFKGYAKLED